jgi:hypothetical protein
MDTSRYEAKLGVFINYIPLMNKDIAEKFMKTIEQILKFPVSYFQLIKKIQTKLLNRIEYI